MDTPLFPAKTQIFSSARKKVVILLDKFLKEDKIGGMKAPPKSSAKVFEKAARLVLRGNFGERYCCDALAILGYSKGSMTVDFFGFLFGPKRARPSGGWWNTEYEEGIHDYESRLIALLLAAELCRRGEDFS
jgi:hypothetical protein